MIVIMLLALAGLVVSIYAYVIEVNISKNPEYKPMCDLSSIISCSRTMGSSYNKLVGISNALIGMAFYSLLFILASFSAATLIFYLASAALIVSIGLAYITYFKIRSLCLVCTAIYGINLLLVVVSYTYVYQF